MKVFEGGSLRIVGVDEHRVVEEMVEESLQGLERTKVHHKTAFVQCYRPELKGERTGIPMDKAAVPRVSPGSVRAREVPIGLSGGVLQHVCPPRIPWFERSWVQQVLAS